MLGSQRITQREFSNMKSLLRCCRTTRTFSIRWPGSMRILARSSYDKILTRDPKNVDALLHIGWVEIRRDNAQGSLEYLGRALALAVQLQNDDEKAAILDAMGNAYHYLNQQDDAIRNYQQAL